MQIIPVLDLMRGQVVRGIAGRRESYRPMVTPLADNADPLAIGMAFHRTFGLDVQYLADLDAIAGAEPAWDVFERLVAAGLHLWVDAGISDVQRAQQLADWTFGDRHPSASRKRPELSRIVVGLESLLSDAALHELAKTIGTERLVFSLDLKAGQPITRVNAWQGRSPVRIAEIVYEAGIRQMIVLDLARVGMGDGVGTEALCRDLKSRFPDLSLTAGGGIRSLEDLQLLRGGGCSGVLVASALHDGRLRELRVESRELRVES